MRHAAPLAILFALQYGQDTMRSPRDTLSACLTCRLGIWQLLASRSAKGAWKVLPQLTASIAHPICGVGNELREFGRESWTGPL